MTKLNQIIAVEQGVKAKATREHTELYRLLDKPVLLTGIARTYQPKDEEGDKLPSESTLVQVNVEDVLAGTADALTRLFDVTLTKEVANAKATANVTVDGVDILSDVPVTYLLFLEKKLVDLYTFISHVPVLDPAQAWSKDESTGVFVSAPVETVRSKKIPKNWVRAEATKEHPAQVDIFHEDVIVGVWTKRDFSGAVPATRKAELLSRVEKLQTAVKFARESANNTEVEDAKAGEKVFTYLFS